MDIREIGKKLYDLRLPKSPEAKCNGVKLELCGDGSGAIIFSWQTASENKLKRLVDTVFMDRDTEVEFQSFDELEAMLTSGGVPKQ